MDKKQLFAVLSCAILCVGIYLFASTKKPAEKKEAAVSADNHSHENGEVESLDIENYIDEVNTAITDSTTKAKIEQLKSSKNYQELTSEYQKLKKPLALLYYATKYAEQKNTPEEYVKTGDYSSILLETAPDEKVKNYLVINALECYQKAVALDSTNAENRVKLAGTYMVGGSQPMQGVSILLDVVRKDSNNISALMLLGRFGIISGQYDKAIARLEKIIYLQPENSEALLLLAEAYNGQGNRKKAVEMLERLKKTMKDPAQRKQIEESIKELKQPNS